MTGLMFLFLLTTEKADGSEKRMTEVQIVALDTAHAWLRVGQHVYKFMRGPDARRVTDVQLQS